MQRRAINWDQPDVQRAIDEFIEQTPGSARNFSQLAVRLSSLTHQKCYRNTVAKKVHRLLSERKIEVALTHPIYTCQIIKGSTPIPPPKQTGPPNTPNPSTIVVVPAAPRQQSMPISFPLPTTVQPVDVIRPVKDSRHGIDAILASPLNTPSETASSTSSQATTTLSFPETPELVPSTPSRFTFASPMPARSTPEAIASSSSASGISMGMPLHNMFTQTSPLACLSTPADKSIPSKKGLDTFNYVNPFANLNSQLFASMQQFLAPVPLLRDSEGRVLFKNAVMGLNHRLVRSQLAIPINNMILLYVPEGTSYHNYICLSCVKSATHISHASRAKITPTGEVWASVTHAPECKPITCSKYLVVQTDRYQKLKTIDGSHVEFLKSIGLDELDQDDDIAPCFVLASATSAPASAPPPTTTTASVDSSESFIQVD